MKLPATQTLLAVGLISSKEICALADLAGDGLAVERGCGFAASVFAREGPLVFDVLKFLAISVN